MTIDEAKQLKRGACIIDHERYTTGIIVGQAEDGILVKWLREYEPELMTFRGTDFDAWQLL